jgi:hypothetical protein
MTSIFGLKTMQKDRQEERAMRPRELFGVGVRILAVWFWTQAAYWGYWAAVKSAGTGLGNPNVSARDDASYMIFYALLGIALMAGVRPLVWLAYGGVSKRDAGGPS